MPRLADALNLERFGVGEAKTFQELEAEVAAGESQILWEGDRPIRLVHIVCIQVISHDGKRLIEERQEFTDGRVRRRGLEGVSEKLRMNEQPLAGAQRALAEELGITANLDIEPLGNMLEEKESPSYPGFISRYQKYCFRVVLPQALYCDVYIEEQVSKKTFFKWISCY